MYAATRARCARRHFSILRVTPAIARKPRCWISWWSGIIRHFASFDLKQVDHCRTTSSRSLMRN